MTPLELFFDLVYVFAFTQVTHSMAAGSSLTSALGGVAVLGVLWWSWASHAWLANQSTPDRGVARSGILAAIVIVLVLSVAIPEVYPHPDESRFAALLFAIGFVVLTTVYTVVNVIVARGNVPLRRQVLRTMIVTIVPVSTALLVGAAVGGIAQILLWLSAVVIEGITVYLTSRDGEWQLPSVAHYAERHRLVVNLALGESIISIGFGARHVSLSPIAIAAVILGVILALGMWRMYFGTISPSAEDRIGQLPPARRAAVATAGTYLHFGIVTGILFAALGIGGATGHLDDSEGLGVFNAAALMGGIALFIASTAVYAWRTTNRSPWPSAIAAAVAIALTPLVSSAPPLVGIATSTLLTLGLPFLESRITSGAVSNRRWLRRLRSSLRQRWARLESMARKRVDEARWVRLGRRCEPVHAFGSERSTSQRP